MEDAAPVFSRCMCARKTHFCHGKSRENAPMNYQQGNPLHNTASSFSLSTISHCQFGAVYSHGVYSAMEKRTKKRMKSDILHATAFTVINQCFIKQGHSDTKQQ